MYTNPNQILLTLSHSISKNNVFFKNKISVNKNDYRVISLVPIPNKNSVIASRFVEGNGDPGTAKDPDPSKTTSCLMESKRWEIIEAPNLIFHLKNVCEVSPRWYGTSCSINTIFI